LSHSACVDEALYELRLKGWIEAELTLVHSIVHWFPQKRFASSV